MSVKRLRIHVTVPNRGQRLDTEEKAIEEPVGAGSTGDAVWVDTIKNGKEKIQADINSADKQSELWPTQAQEPPIEVAPLPGGGIDLDELDLARSNENLIAPASPMANFFVHGRYHTPMWPFKKTQLARPNEFPAVIDDLGGKLRSAGFVVEADRFHYLVHEFVVTTSSELYGELKLALKKLDYEHRALPRDIAAEVRRLIKSIDRICRWR